jgi:hypothetical protein
MTVLAQLNAQRARNTLRESRNYSIRRALGWLRTITIIAFGVWCFMNKAQLQNMLFEFFKH